jgi:hypothetical protein
LIFHRREVLDQLFDALMNGDPAGSKRPPLAEAELVADILEWADLVKDFTTDFQQEIRVRGRRR